MSNLIKHITNISVKNENETFGILRPAGTIVYDKNAGKAYYLKRDALGLECLSSFSNKTEIGAVSGTVIALTIGNLATIFYGFSSGSYGSIVPDNVDGTEVTSIQTSTLDDGVSVAFLGDVKINALDTITLNVEGIAGDFVLNWSATFYTGLHPLLKAHIIANHGNTLNVTFVNI